jgi:hypothetical protein
MAMTVSDTKSKQKTFYGQFSVSLTPLERMYLAWYADMHGRGRGEILRGMLHKYVELDGHFDPDQFAKWAEKTFIPQEEDQALRSMCKDSLAKFKAKRNTGRKAKSAGKGGRR